jgi:hypothetical protein
MQSIYPRYVSYRSEREKVMEVKGDAIGSTIGVRQMSAEKLRKGGNGSK